MKKITIAVTGLNAIDNPGPGVPVIRALRESEHFEARIVGLAYEDLEPGIYLHELVDKSYMIPYPSLGQDTLLKRLEYIHAREEIDVLIPNFDAELFNFIKLQPALEKMGIKTLLPDVEQFEERLKGHLPAYAEKYGLRVPESVEVHNLAEMGAALRQMLYPAVIKGKFYEAYIAWSYDQAVNYFHKISSKWGLPVVVQRFVKGVELNVTAIGDGEGHLIGAVPMRKTYITDNGKGWAGISLADEELLEASRKVVEGSRWPGGMELEFIREEKSGDLYLIEINPRFPAWVYLSVGCGQNHPEALVRMALGEEVEPWKAYEVGKMFVRYSYDLICDLEEFEQIATHGEL